MFSVDRGDSPKIIRVCIYAKVSNNSYPTASQEVTVTLGEQSTCP